MTHRPQNQTIRRQIFMSKGYEELKINIKGPILKAIFTPAANHVA
jgi:hypothetical protein